MPFSLFTPDDTAPFIPLLLMALATFAIMPFTDIDTLRRIAERLGRRRETGMSGPHARALGKPSVVPFELAGDRVSASRVLTGYREAGVLDLAGKAIQVDFVFLALYGLTIGRAASLAAHWLGAPAWVGIAAFGVAILAAILDAVEDVALLSELRDGTGDLAPKVAARCEWAKFSLLLIIVAALAVAAPVAYGTRDGTPLASVVLVTLLAAMTFIGLIAELLRARRALHELENVTPVPPPELIPLGPPSSETP